MGQFKVAEVRDLLNQVHAEEITFSRFVEILNERAALKEKVDYDRLVDMLENTSGALLRITDIAHKSSLLPGDIREAIGSFEKTRKFLKEIKEDK